jgi:hypothetical protein
MKTLRNHLAYLAVAGVFAISVPAFANHPAASPTQGTPVHEGSADRVIVLDAGMKWVNVTGGETIKFSVGGKSFMWNFDTFTLAPVFDLDQIAPSGLLDGRSIKVYVAPDPHHTSG